MAKFVFLYHGGKMPESPEEGEKVMAAWGEWLGGMGDAVIDPGNPVGMSKTVESNGAVVDNGGSNPMSGYSLIEASDMDDAVAKAKSCPQLMSQGTIEIAEAIILEGM